MNLLDNHTVTENKSVTENRIFQIVNDHYDAIQIMSQYPECLRAYKELIQKKRSGQLTDIVNRQMGGLTGSNSQQEIQVEQL